MLELVYICLYVQYLLVHVNLNVHYTLIATCITKQTFVMTKRVSL